MNEEKVLLLYYHRVNDLTNDFNMLCVNQENFRQQMLFLKNNYEVLRFEEDWEKHDKGVVVTFDDGYLDNFEKAVPILEELDIPATIFVTTEKLQSNNIFWWDELEGVLLTGEHFPVSFRIEYEKSTLEWRTETFSQRKNCYKALHFLMKNCITSEKRRVWLDLLWKWKNRVDFAFDKYQTLSEMQLRELSMSKMITIGAHTISHPSLARLSYAEQEKEIVESIKMLERMTDKNVEIFSYPFGNRGSDYNDDTLMICEKAGIKKAATTNPGLWKKDCDALQIPRNCVRDWTLAEFEVKINDYWKE